MKKQGILKAKDDLAEARKASTEMQKAKNLDDAEHAWIKFVEKFGRFFNKLGAAAKGDPRSEGWVATLNQKRSADEMLCYLWQARNCVEHSIEDIAERRPGSIGIGGSFVHFESLVVKNGRISGKLNGSPDMFIRNQPPTLALLPITNRGQIYQVPSNHLGEPITATPNSLAHLALAYGERIITEAEARVK
ncbi:hypothetical protein [Rhizobium rhizogenes]|uniref:hypothetical protein n=1 Tax=Rhizobium rhizogenes TaxID=359 RepID=UPI001572FE4A|nr:hypothetical protein [Rhizobium rhizogenes]NTI74244.1 hypothetical protein [Rhizobium rhizogenes]